MTTQPRTGPSIARHRSRQDYETPREFMAAVYARFGVIAFDLAATPANAQCDHWFTPEADSLTLDWTRLQRNLWLNPPYSNIAPWAKKCAECQHRPAWLLFLVPASVDSKWYREHVHGKAYVMPLEPRLTFEGETDPYPKPLMLCAYGFNVSGFEPWRWRK